MDSLIFRIIISRSGNPGKDKEFMNDLVSVVVPIYNAEKYLKKCLDSIVNQTYKSLEIILLNDGSIDGSDGICREYADIDSRIKYIKKENSGQSDTRNYGIDIANGQYIYFMDSDDYIDEGYLEYAINEIHSENADLIITNYYHELENGESWNEREFQEGIYDLRNEKDRYKFLVNVFLPYKCGFEVWNRLYVTRIIKDNGIKFPIFKPVVAEDVCFNLIYNLCAENIIVTNERFYHYLHNDNSTMAKNKGGHLDKYNEVSRLGYEFIKDRVKLEYLRVNYVFVHILLIYHELMNESLDEMKERIRQIDDKKTFRRLDTVKVRNLLVAVNNMGIARAVKYSMLGILYRIWL